MRSASLMCAQESYTNDNTALLKMSLYKQAPTDYMNLRNRKGKEKERKRGDLEHEPYDKVSNKSLLGVVNNCYNFLETAISNFL